MSFEEDQTNANPSNPGQGWEGSAKNIINSKVLAYHPHPESVRLGNRRPSINLGSEHYECALADVRQVMVKEPYEFWKRSSLKRTVSGVKSGWYHNRDEGKIKYFISEVLLGLVVVFAQVPETISFAMTARMDPIMGLHGAWMIGLISAIFGGRPGLICGTTASVSVITESLIVDGVSKHLIWPILITAGLFLVLFSFFNLSFINRFISKNVMIGFCNGLGVLIFMSQLHMFKDKSHEYVTGEVAVHMAIMCLIAMISFQFWPKLPYVSLYVPAALIAVLVSIVYEVAIVDKWRGLSTLKVGDIGNIDARFKYPRLFWQYPSEIATFNYTLKEVGLILKYGMTFFIVMVLESLMTINVMDGRYDEVSNGDQTLFAIGIGNVVSGMFGGLGGNTMIGLSNLLASGGGCGKEAPAICALTILIVTFFFPAALNVFPTAGLAGIMFIVSLHTFSFDSIRMIFCSLMPQRWIDRFPSLAHAIPPMDAIILLAVTVLVPTLGLHVGIMVGVIISSFALVDKIFRGMRVFKHMATREEVGLVAVYDVVGPLFFSSTATLHKSFDFEGDPSIVIVRMTNSNIMDYSAMETLSTVRQAYENLGKRLIVKNLKKECELKLLRSQARLEWDKDRDHETQEVNIPRLVNFGDEMPDLPGITGHFHRSHSTDNVVSDSSGNSGGNSNEVV